MSQDRSQLEAEAVIQFRNASQNILDFTRFTFPGYVTNWHHELVASKLDAFLRGDIKRLMIFQPPRTGKSELVTRRLPSFALGLNPNLRIIAASYSGDLANSFNSDAQRIMESARYQALFPNHNLPTMSKFKNRDKFKQTSSEVEILVPDREKAGFGKKAGFYKTVGVGGSLTGFGFDIGIIDDPFKNRKEADSAVTREAVYGWYASTFLTRAEKNARFLLTMTRWHDDDLAGRLLKKGGWEVITLPHVKDEEHNEYDPREVGDILWPWKFGEEEIEFMRREGGPREWASIHQQKPQQDGGNIVKREWWKYYKPDKLPRNFDQVIQSWDFTFKDSKHSDYVVGGVWGKKGPDKYLLDVVRKQAGFIESLSMIKTMSAKWPEAYSKVIEEKANGAAVIDSLKKKLVGIIPFVPDKHGSKEARAHAVSGQIEAGNVYLPEDAPWVHDYIEEWSAFPNGKHDDQVDMTTQALLKMSASGIDRLQRMLAT